MMHCIRSGRRTTRAGAFLTCVGLVCLLVGIPDEGKAEEATGTIKISCGKPGKLVLKLPNVKEKKEFKSDCSEFTVPAGKYQLWYYTCTAKDGEGQEWYATTGLGSRDDDVFELKAGETKTVKAGPPFKAKVAARKRGTVLGLDLKMAGAGGDSYRFSAKGKKVPPPAFEVKDKTGKKVLSGSFAYG